MVSQESLQRLFVFDKQDTYIYNLHNILSSIYQMLTLYLCIYLLTYLYDQLVNEINKNIGLLNHLQ